MRKIAVCISMDEVIFPLSIKTAQIFMTAVKAGIVLTRWSIISYENERIWIWGLYFYANQFKRFIWKFFLRFKLNWISDIESNTTSLLVSVKSTEEILLRPQAYHQFCYQFWFNLWSKYQSIHFFTSNRISSIFIMRLFTFNDAKDKPFLHLEGRISVSWMTFSLIHSVLLHE